MNQPYFLIDSWFSRIQLFSTLDVDTEGNIEGLNELAVFISFFEILSKRTSFENFVVSATTINGMWYVLQVVATIAYS